MQKTYGYARVSTREQKLDRQLDALRAYVADERDIITDKESGKDFDRPGYRSLRETLLREGDTLVIKSLDRLGRNKAQIKEELEHYRARGIRIKILDLPTTMAEVQPGQEWILEMINNILIEVLGTIAEQERLTIRRRQAEGIEAAHARGVHLGRPKAKIPSDWAEVTAAWRAQQISARMAYERLGISKTTFYKLVRQEDAGEL